MLKLTDVEIAVMDRFRIVPNNFNGEGALPTPEEVRDWLVANGHPRMNRVSSGERVLKSLKKKLWDSFEYDSLSCEDTATWVLSHYFTLEQLRAMEPEEAERFMKDWKYQFGYRKCDGWGRYYIRNAIDALTGVLVLDEKDTEYFYLEKEEDE